MPTRHLRALLLVSSICLYGCREHGERTASQRLAQSLPATAQQESIRAWSPDSRPIGPERLAPDSGAEGSDVERAFYTSKPPAGVVHAGLRLRSSTTNELRGVKARLAVPQASVLYRDTVLAVTSVTAFYSVDAAYDSATHGLLRSALILHDSTGRVVAYRLEDSKAFECDGCGAPTYEEGLNRLYSVMY